MQCQIELLQLSVNFTASNFYFLTQVASINTQSLFSQLTTFADNDSEVAMEIDVKSSLAVGGIRDPLGCGFTVVCDSGEMLRCSVTEMFRNSTGEDV